MSLKLKMERDSQFSITGTFTKANGKITWLMEMEFILSTKIKLFTKEISVRAKNKARVK
jgi:hypothetical protein